MNISHKQIALFVIICESVLLICSTAALLLQKEAQKDKLQEMENITISSREMVYTQMEKAGAALNSYEETCDTAYLADARSAVGKTAAICVAYGNSYVYRDSTDTANDIIQEWGINFLIKLYSYLDDLCKNEVLESDSETLLILSDVFQPQSDASPDGDAPQITFMSLYWNASNSSLAEDPAWMNLITYDFGTLQRFDFS